MQYGGQHAHFAAPQSRAAICTGLEMARKCTGASAARLEPVVPPRLVSAANCDEYVVVATDEYDSTAWIGFCDCSAAAHHPVFVCQLY